MHLLVYYSSSACDLAQNTNFTHHHTVLHSGTAKGAGKGTCPWAPAQGGTTNIRENINFFKK